LEEAKRRVADLEAKRQQLDDADPTPRLHVTVFGGPGNRIEVTESGAFGKVVGTIETTSVEMLARFVRRTWADAAGPKRVHVVFRERTGERLDLTDVKAGRLVHLYRAAEPAANPPVVRVGVSHAEAAYIIEPPDMLTAEVTLRGKSETGEAVTRPLPVQPVSG